MVKASSRKDLIYPYMYLKKNEFGINFSFAINIINILGKPFVHLIDTNYDVIYNELKIKNIHVSLSHEQDYSIAMIVMEK